LTTRKEKREIVRKRKTTTDRYFLTHRDWIFELCCCSFILKHVKRWMEFLYATRGDRKKKCERTKRNVITVCVACDCNTKNTMFWGRKKKEEEKQQQPKKKKICCACPETKEPRDQCVGEFGAEDERCKKLVEAHLVCLRKEGFDV